MSQSVAIAVIGIGCRFPGSSSPRELWENVLARRQQFRRFVDSRLPVRDYVDADDSDRVYASRAAYIDGFEFDWRAHRIPYSTVQSTDVVQWLALDVALQALESSGLELTDELRERTGVVVGNSLTGEQSRASTMRLRWPFVRRALREAMELHGIDGEVGDSLQTITSELYKSAFPDVNEDSLQGGLSNTIAGRICNYLDLHGGGYVVDGACSSSLLAVATGADRLSKGDLDVAIVGGVDVSLDPMELVGFARTGALSPDDMRVYDAKANGFIPGEGAGFVVLKRLDDAMRDGDTVYAVLRGWGVSSDGKGAITAPSGSGQARAIVRAYRSAGLGPDDVDFVEGHGTGTKVGDLAELRGLQMAFEQLGGAGQHRWGMTSIKSLVGHMKAASGMGGFIKTVLAVNQRVVPPTAGVRRPNAVFKDECVNLFPVLHGQQRPSGDTVRAGVSAMGFGGINTHVLLESADPPQPELRPALGAQAALAAGQRSELFCLAAPTQRELADKVRALVSLAEPLAVAEMPSLAMATNRAWRSDNAVRAAIVAADAPSLTKAAQSLLDTLTELQTSTERSAPDGSWWLAQDLSDPVVGFVYPGQGAQYPGTAFVPLQRYEWARDMRRSLSAVASKAGLHDAESWLEPVDHTQDAAKAADRLRATQIAQPLICLSSAVYTELLGRLGVTPRVVGGHSLGELSALWAAGAMDLESLFALAVARGQVMAGTAPDGTMASLRCSAELAERLVSSVEGVDVCNRNTPDHTVVGGSVGGVEQVLAKASAQGIDGRRLRVSHAFHTAHMDGAVAALAQTAFDGRVVPDLRCSALSSMDGRPIQAGTQLLAHFQRQLRSPVDFVALTHRMASVCDLVVEVGPGRVLSGLISHTTGRDLCTPTEVKDDSFDALNRTLARLSIWGVPLHLHVLYEQRAVAEPVCFASRVFIGNPCERPLSSTSTPVRLDQVQPAQQPSNGASVSVDDLKAYLAARSNFLIDVVVADLRSSPQPIATAQPKVAAQVTAVVTAAIPEDGVWSVPEQAAAISADPPDESDDIDVHGHLLQLLIAKTGFDADALLPESRLLDDLNLDSIKAGEVLHRIVQHAGVAGQFELTDFTNSPIGDIVQRIERARAEGGPQPAASASFEGAEQWIRALELSLERVERSVLLPGEPGQGSVLVLHAGLDEQAVGALRDAADKVRICDWQPWTAAPAATRTYDHVLVLLPPMSDPIEAVPTVVGMLGAALKRASRTVLCVCHGAPFGLSHGAQTTAGVGLSSLVASLQEEHKDRTLGVLHLLTEPTDAHWIQPTLDACLRIRAYATVAVDPQHPDLLWVPRLRATPERPVVRSVSDAEDLWLITGGAKGITLECALKLAEVGAKRFVLLGRTPSPTDPEHPINEGLRRYQQLGAEAHYLSCDVTDAARVAAVIAQIESTLGPIHHIVHGAGVNRAARFTEVSAEQAVREVALKVGGLHNVLAHVDLAALRSVVGISSIIGVSGMPGNTWYSYANEALDRQIAELGRAHPHLHARTVAFTLWGETGMVDGLSTVEHLRGLGVVPLRTAPGTAHFLTAYGPASPTRTVVTGAMSRFAAWQLLTGAYTSHGAPFGGQIISLCPTVEAVVQLDLSVDTDPYLRDHDFHGTLLFPTVMGLQAMASVARLVTGEAESAPVTFQQVSLERPITVEADEQTRVVVHALAVEGGAIEVSLYVKTTDYRLAHFKALVSFDVPSPPVVAAIAPDQPTRVLPSRDLYGDLLFQGPRFQRMGPVLQLDADSILFQAVPVDDMGPAREGAGAPSLGDPYLRDALLQAPAVPLAPDQLLPVSIKSLTRFAAPPSEVFVRATITARRGDEIEAEVLLVDRHGTVYEHLVGYCARIVQRRPERPAVADYLDPAAFNERALAKLLKKARNSWDLPLPDLHLLTDPSLSADDVRARHRAQAQAISSIIGSSTTLPTSADLSLDWTDEGRPILTSQGHPSASAHVSLSHDDQGQCLVVLGETRVGCDIERIAARSFAEWQFLLGRHNAILFNRIFSVGEPLADSGHRVWSAMEVAYKLGAASEQHEVPLELLGYRDGFYVFWVRDTSLSIVTFTFRPIGAQPVVVALGVERSQRAQGHQSPTRLGRLAPLNGGRHEAL